MTAGCRARRRVGGTASAAASPAGWAALGSETCSGTRAPTATAVLRVPCKPALALALARWGLVVGSGRAVVVAGAALIGEE